MPKAGPERGVHNRGDDLGRGQRGAFPITPFPRLLDGARKMVVQCRRYRISRRVRPPVTHNVHDIPKPGTEALRREILTLSPLSPPFLFLFHTFTLSLVLVRA